jgi:hypothetical protein
MIAASEGSRTALISSQKVRVFFAAIEVRERPARLVEHDPRRRAVEWPSFRQFLPANNHKLDPKLPDAGTAVLAIE